MTIEKISTEFQDVQTPRQTLTTSCQKCVFAIKEGKTQTGCVHNKIEKLQQRGVNVIEAEDLEENEFYVLESWCSTYREEIWKTAHEGKDLQKVLENETYPKVGFVVIIKDNMDGLQLTVESIINQEKFKPSQILFVGAGSVGYVDIIEQAQELLEDKEIEYKVQAVNSEMPNLAIIDEAFNNAKNGFYSVLESGKEAPTDLISVLHKALNEDLKKVGYVKGFDGINGMTVQCTIHKYLYGNRGADIETKILDGEEFDGVDKDNSLIKTWDELR